MLLIASVSSGTKLALTLMEYVSTVILGVSPKKFRVVFWTKSIKLCFSMTIVS